MGIKRGMRDTNQDLLTIYFSSNVDADVCGGAAVVEGDAVDIITLHLIMLVMVLLTWFWSVAVWFWVVPTWAPLTGCGFQSSFSKAPSFVPSPPVSSN